MTIGHRNRWLDAETRFWLKVDKNGSNGCWIWRANRDKDGYGKFTNNYKTLRAHRFSYELLVEKIPEGMVLDHLCRRTSCVNPEHLQPVSSIEYIHRGEGLASQNKSKTHCINGHEFDELNTYIRPNGARSCKKCMRIRRGLDPEPTPIIKRKPKPCPICGKMFFSGTIVKTCSYSCGQTIRHLKGNDDRV